MWRRILRRPPGGAAPLVEGAGERFDHIEHGGHLPLVPRQLSALGQGVGDYEKTLGRRRADVDRPARRDLVVLVGRQLDCGRFILMAGELAVDALPKRAQDLVLLERCQADQRYDAVAEQGHEALSAGPKGERGCGQHVRALQARRLDAIADQERAAVAAGTRREGARGLVGHGWSKCCRRPWSMVKLGGDGSCASGISSRQRWSLPCSLSRIC